MELEQLARSTKYHVQLLVVKVLDEGLSVWLLDFLR